MQMLTNEPVEILAAVSHERLLRPRELDERGANAEDAPSRERVDGDAEKFGGLLRGQQVRARVIGSLVMHRHAKNFLLPLQLQWVNHRARSARILRLVRKRHHVATDGSVAWHPQEMKSHEKRFSALKRAPIDFSGLLSVLQDWFPTV